MEERYKPLPVMTFFVFNDPATTEIYTLSLHDALPIFPLDLGSIRGFTTRFHLYTVPGQVFYDASRKLILKGVDGVVFVADSQEERMEANIESIRNLEENLREHGFDLAVIPYALQFNKRDLPTAVPVDQLYRVLNYKREPTFEAVATTGLGVFDTLKAVAKQILIELRK